MRIERLTPVLIVDEVEPCIEFWKARGFEATTTVPEGGRIGFAMLTRAGIELRYQSVASVARDVPAVLERCEGTWRTAVCSEVDDIESAASNLSGVDTVVPRRQTFYGTQEIIVRDPAGNVVSFAQFLP